MQLQVTKFYDIKWNDTLTIIIIFSSYKQTISNMWDEYQFKQFVSVLVSNISPPSNAHLFHYEDFPNVWQQFQYKCYCSVFKLLKPRFCIYSLTNFKHQFLYFNPKKSISRLPTKCFWIHVQHSFNYFSITFM